MLNNEFQYNYTNNRFFVNYIQPFNPNLLQFEFVTMSTGQSLLLSSILGNEISYRVSILDI